MVMRSRKVSAKYDRHLKKLPDDTCEFCTVNEENHQFITETKSFKIIRNIFPYSFWDLHEVEDHLLLIPKKHTDSLNDLSAREAVEFVDLVGSYESQGYNVYARAPVSSLKSVAHQHTHLIKSHQKRKRVIFYLHKPRIRIIR